MKAAKDIVSAKTRKKFNKTTVGWIEQSLGEETIRVYFFGAFDEETYYPAYSVDVKNGEAVSETYAAYADKAPFEPALNKLARARMVAQGQPFERCSKDYNTVTFPASDADLFVYLLPTGTKSDVARIGGNYRFRVNGDTGDVTAFQKFTNSCIALSTSSGNSNYSVAALTISQVLTPHPTEIHVFMSLLHGVDIYTMTTENRIIWRVSAGEVSVVQQ